MKVGREERSMQTFEELAAVDLAGGYFEGYDMALNNMLACTCRSRLQYRRTCASFRSLIGIPIVDVSLPMLAVCA